MESACFRREWLEAAQVPAQVAERERPVGIHEPVHWFDPSMTMASRDKLVITALDEFVGQRVGDLFRVEVAEKVAGPVHDLEA